MRILPLAALLVGLALPAAAETLPAYIAVTGEGVMLAVPDMATISLGVVTQGATAADALGQNSGLVAAVLAEVAAMGIAARDIQTAGLSVDTMLDYSNPEVVRIKGYEARNVLRIRVRDLPMTGALIDAAFAAGANEFNGLTFALEDDRAALDAARQAAVADARARAELYAAAAGVSLGRIGAISETGDYGYDPGFGLRAAPMSAMLPVPIAEGELTITASVTISWELVQ